MILSFRSKVHFYWQVNVGLGISHDDDDGENLCIEWLQIFRSYLERLLRSYQSLHSDVHLAFRFIIIIRQVHEKRKSRTVIKIKMRSLVSVPHILDMGWCSWTQPIPLWNLFKCIALLVWPQCVRVCACVLVSLSLSLTPMLMFCSRSLLVSQSVFSFELS